MKISLTCKLLKKSQAYDVNRNIYFSPTNADFILTCFGENWKYQVFMSETMQICIPPKVIQKNNAEQKACNRLFKSIYIISS